MTDMGGLAEQPEEVTNERIYADLKSYQETGLIQWVLPTDPLGEEWNIGWNGQILKFLTKEGVVGFLTGVTVCVDFLAKKHNQAAREFSERIETLSG